MAKDGEPWDDSVSATTSRDTSVDDAVRDLRAEVAGRRPYVTVMSGAGMGRLIAADDREISIGRAPDADIVFDDESISRLHARLVPRGGVAVELVDLGSTNGTYVNGQRISNAHLLDGDKVLIGSAGVLRFGVHDELDARFHLQLVDASIRDGLTGLFNQRHFLASLERELAFSRRHRTPVALVLIDIDHFKQVNDVHGHLVGDAILLQVAQVVGGRIRLEDMLCRYGGDELVILLRQVAEDKAVAFADRIRRSVERHPFEYLDRGGAGQVLHVTLSLGVAAFDPDTHAAPSDLIEAADRYLYAAKRAGRNGVASSQTHGPSHLLAKGADPHPLGT
jgi:two-component system, cell cycle response regulator